MRNQNRQSTKFLTTTLH